MKSPQCAFVEYHLEHVQVQADRHIVVPLVVEFGSEEAAFRDRHAFRMRVRVRQKSGFGSDTPPRTEGVALSSSGAANAITHKEFQWRPHRKRFRATK